PESQGSRGSAPGSRVQGAATPGRCGYCKNLKKTVKAGQTQTRERKSTQRAGKMLSKSTMVNLSQPSVKHGQH
ncbi:hypothetical protein Tco_1222981, partial [Tanacetum coccineum]